MRTDLQRLLCAVALLALNGCNDELGSSAQPTVVRVAVAANFAHTAEDLARRFEAHEHSIAIELSVGSTGALYTQIVNGAPFDLLLAADQARPQRLVAEGRAQSARPYAVGLLALTGSALKDSELVGGGPVAADALAALLRSPNVLHVAIADPGTAPYGVAAVEALRALGVHDELSPRLARGIDVGQSHQFAVSGAADLAFVALSQALATTELPHVVVPSSLYTPVAQDAALLTTSGGARLFLDFLGSDEARAVLVTSGYDVPGPN